MDLAQVPLLEGKTTGQEKIRQPPTAFLVKIFIVLASVLGVFYVLLLPPLQAADENRHLVRALSVAQGEWKPQVLTSIPLGVATLIRTYPSVNRGVGRPPFFQSNLPELIWRPTNESEAKVLVANPAANLYSPIPYLPSAMAMKAAWYSGASPLMVLYVGRLANLMCYVALCAFTLILSPESRIALLALLLMPMSLHQAASLSADALTFGLAFLFISYVLRQTYMAEEILKTSQASIVILLLLLTALCKFNPCFAFLVALIPAKRFNSGLAKAAFVLACVLLSTLTAAGWQRWDKQNFQTFRQWKSAYVMPGGERAEMVLVDPGDPDADLSANAKTVADHPILWVKSFLYTLHNKPSLMGREFVGTFGWLSLPIPKWLEIFYLTLLACSALMREHKRGLVISQRILLFGIFIASLVGLFVLLFTLETRRSEYAEFFKSHLIILVQGRYLIPFAPFLFYAVSTFRVRRYLQIVAGVSLGILFTNIMALLMLSNIIKPDKYLH